MRKLEDITKTQINKIAITYDIHTDSLYKEGKKEGEKIGVEKVFQVKKLWKEGHGELEITKVTKLSLSTIKRIIQDL